MSDVSERLMMVMKQKDISYRQLAELTGITKSSVANYVNGTRSIPLDKLLLIAKVLNVDAAWLIGWSDERIPIPPKHSRKLVPILGTVRCGSNGLAIEEPEGYEPADVENPDEYFYLRADGDSMEPYIYEGDYVLVHKQDDVDSGELAIVIVGGEEGTLKKVLKQANTVILQPFNARYPARIFVGRECASIRIVGRVMKTTHNW